MQQGGFAKGVKLQAIVLFQPLHHLRLYGTEAAVTLFGKQIG